MTSAPASGPAAVRFDDVSLTRGDVLALDHVSVAMPRGETTAVLGASGSGKSTLIQLVIGLLRPDAGTVTVLDQRLDYDNLQALRRRIGYAIQEVALLPHLRVRQNIVLPARLNDWTEQETSVRLAELVALLHLPPAVLDRYPHELSGGQQQRAGICRAMMLRPELLLLDEPFSGLDAITRQSVHEQFLEFQREEPVSAVLVTHDPQEAINLAAYLVVMRQARVLQHGRVDEVVERPANDYVARLCAGLGSVES